MALVFNHWSGKASNLPVARHINHHDSSLIHQCMEVWSCPQALTGTHWQDRWHSERILREKKSKCLARQDISAPVFCNNRETLLFSSLCSSCTPSHTTESLSEKPYLLIRYLYSLTTICYTCHFRDRELLRNTTYILVPFLQSTLGWSVPRSPPGFDQLHLP